MSTSTFRWLIWSLFAFVWTLLLVLPFSERVGESLDDITLGRKYIAAKVVHTLAYAVFAILSGWLRAPPRYRWLLAALLMTHGTATELIQLVVPGRGGSLTDVGWDNLGVALGLVVTWRWWASP